MTLNNGGILILAILLPNLLWALFPSNSPTPGKTAGRVELFEQIGRAGTLVTPFFYSFHLETTLDGVFWVVLLSMLAVYFACWLRYFINGRSAVWLYRKFMAIPVPMSICPVICFLAASVLLRSLPLFAFSILFGIYHIFICIHEQRQVETLQPAS